MFRSRGENLRSVFILLFLNVAFFLLEHQDPEKYVRVFRFEWNAVRDGELWRAVTWQFTQAGEGWLEALSLFVTLLLLYMMGSALEEAWGTTHFLRLFAISTLGSAAAAAWLGIPLLGTYFVYYTLLFVYAAAFPQHTLYLFGVVPVRFRLIAMISLAAIVYGSFAGGTANIAAIAGAAAGFLYYLSQRVKLVAAEVPASAPRPDTVAVYNAARFVGMKRALNGGLAADAERILAQLDRERVDGVNICPPPDFKPESSDGYCIRCEGFAECSARYLRSRLAAAPAAAPPTTAPAASPEPAPLV
jgi:membrane associated rhomboid family serine protease